jgi:predicted acyl esterase
MLNVKSVSTAFALTLALMSLTPAHADGVTKRLYLASNGNADATGDKGMLRWGPWERESADRFTITSGKPGAVSYTTAPLDRPVQTDGRLTLELYATGEAQDAGFTATVDDVQADGGVVSVASAPVTSSSASRAQDKAQLYRVDLDATAHAFAPGHRIRVTIAPAATADVDTRVLHGIAHPSALVLRVE